MGFNEFISNVKKASGPKNHKITNSYGVYDAFKRYRKVRPDVKKYVLTESEYFGIIRRINQKLADQLSMGWDVKFPSFMGGLEIKKYVIEPRLDNNGKLIFKAPVDWETTLKLWFEHDEAKKNKILIKFNQKAHYRIIYSKRSAKYKNMSYFTFRTGRALRKQISDAINSGLMSGCGCYKN